MLQGDSLIPVGGSSSLLLWFTINSCGVVFLVYMWSLTGIRIRRWLDLSVSVGGGSADGLPQRSWEGFDPSRMPRDRVRQSIV